MGALHADPDHKSTVRVNDNGHTPKLTYCLNLGQAYLGVIPCSRRSVQQLKELS